MTAFREEGRLVVVVPEHMTTRQRRALIPGLVERYLAKEARQRPPRGDEEITARAVELYRSSHCPPHRAAGARHGGPLGVHDGVTVGVLHPQHR
ncbi:hypothetical protein [Propioniciclava flava]